MSNDADLAAESDSEGGDDEARGGKRRGVKSRLN
jgi:hypothetical protein